MIALEGFAVADAVGRKGESRPRFQLGKRMRAYSGGRLLTKKPWSW